MGGCWSRLGALLGLVALLWAEGASAESLPLELDWRAPEECPTGDEVRVELERIAHVSAEREPTALVAHAHIIRVQSGYFLELSTLKDGQIGKKKLFARTCGPLKEAATLVLALAFGDGVEVADEGSPAPTPEAQPTPRPPPPPSLQPARRPAPASPPRERLRFSPWIAGMASFGLLGSAAGGARVGLGAFRGHFGAELRGSLFLPASVPEQNGIGASFDAVAAALAGCVRVGERPLWFSGCIGVEAAAIHGVSAGAARNLEATVPHFSAVPSFALALPVLGPLALRAEADLGIALDRPDFYVRPEGVPASASGSTLILHRVPELSGAVGLGIAVAL